LKASRLSAALRGGWRIHWPCAVFGGIALDEGTPNHSTISRTRRLDLETPRHHQSL
jgi:hypothetical protein